MIKYFKIFYSYLNFRILLSLISSLVVRFTDALGIAMFIPLLSQSANYTKTSSDTELEVFNKITSLLDFKPTVYTILCAIIAIFCVKGLMLLFEAAYQSYLVTFLYKKLRKMLIERLSSVAYGFFIEKSLAHYNNIITVEMNRAANSFSRFISALSKKVSVAIYLSVSFLIYPKFAIPTLFAGAFIILFFKKFAAKAKKLSMKTSRENERLQSLMLELLGAFKYLKATDKFVTLNDRLKNNIDHLAKLQLKTGVLNSFVNSIREPIIVILIGLIVFFHIEYYGQQFSSIIVVLILFYKAMTELIASQNAWHAFMSSVGGTHAVADTLSEMSKRKEQIGEEQIHFNDSIKAKKLSYGYTGELVLQDINFTIKKNETVAFVGISGSGKTTLIDLLTGVLNFDKGTVFIDDKPLSTSNLGNWRKKIGYVTQENIIFNDTIQNNISLWGNGRKFREKHNQKIDEAICAAHCNEFIGKNKNETKMIIGDRGNKLSGGQRQRISIAREIYFNPDVLILDEATSSLDTKSEHIIQKSIEKMKGEKTIIIISHRLSTIKNVDKIFVLEEGKIVEQGTFDELIIKKNSVFNSFMKVNVLG